jgi:hypothetical protein
MVNDLLVVKLTLSLVLLVDKESGIYWGLMLKLAELVRQLVMLTLLHKKLQTDAYLT